MELHYRKDRIIELCKGKSVLHLGFIQHAHLYQTLIEEDNWLHGKIDQVAEKMVGIDYLDEHVDIINKKYGYECYQADVCELDKLDLKSTFDIILCGELIEHLENPGLMLQGIKRFFHPGTQLIITTPNPWSRNRLRLIKKGIYEEQWLNPEHTCWFSFNTLKQLLHRYDFKEIEYSYYIGEKKEENRYFSSDILNKIKQKKDSLFIKPFYSNGLFFVAKI